MVIGFGEELRHRINHLEALRSLQDRSYKKGLRGFDSFISWTLQHNQNTSLGRSRHSGNYGAGASEYLRHVAFSRLYLDNILHHQASWPTLGVDVASIALHFGCDDFGSTMIEENVVSKAGALTEKKWAMSPDEIIAAIKKAGFTPAQRDSAYVVRNIG
jgi:cyclic dehypoxanthinyl futalosine synthase